MSDDLQNLEMSDVDADRPSQTDDIELRRSQQLEFLLTVLQSFNESNGNPDIIYPLLCQNLELLDFNIIEVLKNWATAKLSKVARDLQEAIATDIFNFGNLIQQFPLGNKAVNMEWSIECCLLALKIFTVSEHNENWSAVQHNLATAYTERIRGNRAENLERAIECYHAALDVQTQADSPVAWAMTKNNLAAAYSKRIRGDRAENLERAFDYYWAALEVTNQADFPLEWAMTQSNLAVVYSERVKGDRVENLERSIECCLAALEVYTEADVPIDWAMTQNNLAITYSKRIKGDRAENLNRSIECYRAVLKVYTPESFPREWANIQVNLARFSIEILRDYQVATEHLQSSCEHLLDNNSDTGLLAETMFELARCFHQTGCLGQAKIYFKDSIRLYQRLENFTQVAAVTSALGNLELQMGCIDDARIHLQTALEFYQAAGNLTRVASIQELQQCLPEPAI